MGLRGLGGPIARRARVNKAMLYYHFRSKAGLYLAILQEQFAALGRAAATLECRTCRPTNSSAGSSTPLPAKRIRDLLRVHLVAGDCRRRAAPRDDRRCAAPCPRHARGHS